MLLRAFVFLVALGTPLTALAQTAGVPEVVAPDAGAGPAEGRVVESDRPGDAPVAPVAPPEVTPAPPVVTPPPAAPPPEPATEKPQANHWYEKLKFRGYTQIRYNRLYADEDKLRFDGDKSVGADSGFLIRRARLILQGDPFDMLSVYLQPDFAGSVNGDQHVAALRDWYGDVFLDPATKCVRFRVGQSKVPYGWENMQSSSNRLPLDRSDGINSAWPGERDLGAFLYVETTGTRRLYKELVDSGLKGSGDYGVLGIGVANGQTLNKPERNENRHLFARVNVPFEIGTQVLELGVNAYTGQFSITKDDTTRGADRSIDARVGGSVVLYPKPIGVQVEYNVGYGPERSGNEIRRTRPLDGGYVLLSARLFGSLFPFVRFARYDGGRKEQLNTPHQRIHEVEGGVEYTFHKAVELTLAANYSGRETNDVLAKGTVLRAQVQLNY